METVTIQTKLISYSDRNLLVEAIMWNENKTHPKAMMWVRFTHFNLQTRKSHRHSEELMQFFNEVVFPLPQETTFEERVKSFKR